MKNRFPVSRLLGLSPRPETVQLRRKRLLFGIIAGLLSVNTAVYAQQTVVANFTNSTMTIVDLASGDRTVLSGGVAGTGTAMSHPVGTVREANGNILVGEEANPSKLFRIDPVTGNRTVISSSALTIGTGPALGFAYGLGVEADGTIIVGSSNIGTLYRVDPATGNRTVFASASVGSGTTMRSPFGILVDTDGSIIFVP